MAITLHSKGSFRRSRNLLARAIGFDINDLLNKYGKKGVEALRLATPVDTGKTADSWYYEIYADVSTASISWFNHNVNKGVPIALIIEYGHVTGWGGYVPPYPYIEQALSPIISELTEAVWKEYTDG